MVKNALQAQLLKAGLVDNKKAKKLSKQAVHEQRTGQSSEARDQGKNCTRQTAKTGQKIKPLNLRRKRYCKKKSSK